MPYTGEEFARVLLPHAEHPYGSPFTPCAQLPFLQCKPGPPYTTDVHSYYASTEITQSFQHFPFLEPFFASWEKDWWPYGPFLEVAGLTTPTDQLFSDNWNVPLALCAVYLILCFGGRVFMSGRAPFDLKYPLAGWNLFLATFSFIGASRTVPQLIANLQIHGLDATMCMSADLGYGSGASGFWTVMFILSKPIELFDTVFIVLRKKPLIFLHWYHHVTVLLFCWHSYAHRSPNALWFVAMNYSVHAVMYGYYGLMCFVKIPKPVAISITLFQTSQMFVGVYVQYKTYSLKQLGQPSLHYDTRHCEIEPSNQVAGAFMYFTYLLLFLHILFTKVLFQPPLEKARSQKKTEKEETKKGR